MTEFSRTFAIIAAAVDRTANDDVVQELDEFRTFASEGVDPTTAEPFDSPERLLRLYLGRQIPAANEVHLGMDSARVFAVDRSADASSPVDGEPYNLAEDGQLIEEIRTSTAPSGIADSPVGPVRWGKVSINDSDSTFVIAVFTGPDRAEVDAMIRVFAWGSVAGLALTALFGYVVAGQILAHAWGYDFDPASNVVDVYVRTLRRKIGADRLVTVRGAGYRLT